MHAPRGESSRSLITLFGVVAYGPWMGFAVAMTGIMGSVVAVYYAGRAPLAHPVAGAGRFRIARPARGRPRPEEFVNSA